MAEEKDMVGDYEILDSVLVGYHNIVLGQNDKVPLDSDERYMCGYREIKFGLSLTKEIEASNSYPEIALLFAQRVKEAAEEVIKEAEQRKAAGVSVELITAEQCLPISEKQIEGEVVVLKPTSLAPSFQRADCQLQLVTGGFGAAPNACGRTIYVQELYSGKETAFWRSDVLGIIKPECMPEWAKPRLREILAYQQDLERHHRQQAQRKDRDER